MEHGLHVAIIPDGNGRWATRRGRPRRDGHAAGARVVPRLVRAAPGLGIDVLTVFALSGDNLCRPADEVASLFRLVHVFLERERARCVRHGVRVRVLGRRDRLPDGLARAVERVEAATAGGTTLCLRIALDYSSRDAVVAAARRAPAGEPLTRAGFARLLDPASGSGARDVDLLIRTGGERRLSDFLLWECAYAELYFTDCCFPDFGVADLAAALADYRGRERRFGRLPAAAAG
jgi:undecaprenyl diphosphate synthase